MSHRDSPTPSPATTLEDACANAGKLAVAGHADLAERLYRTVLKADPAHPAANHGLGMLEVRMQRAASGLPHLLAAIESKPQIPDYWLGYLEALLLFGQLEDARSTLALARAHGLEGKRVETFTARLQAACSPAAPAQSRAERRREARRDPADPKRMEAALLALVAEANFAAALPAARALTERFPDRGQGWKVLGSLLGAQEQFEDAVVAMRTSVRLLPDDAEAHANLGASLFKMLRFDEAESVLRHAVQSDPKFQPPYIHLANVLHALGRFEEAEELLRQAIMLPGDLGNPENSHHTSWLFLMSHNSKVGPAALFAAHRQVAARLEGRVPPPAPHSNPRIALRRLKVGFVSADLCNHAVASFVETTLTELYGRPDLELYAYYNNKIEDEVTGRFRRAFHRWRDVHQLSDEGLAGTIRGDEIDVMIDLSGHTSMNRLGTLAYKPAPIQVSWLGYPGTTGLRAVDYYIADRDFLPPEKFASQFTEKLVFLPAAYGFQPDARSPPVGPLPALTEGFMTFASFNRLGKINPATIGLWSKLLSATPNSMMIVAGGSSEREWDGLRDQFAAHGVARERVAFYPRSGMDSYLALHNQVDICLDTTPYTGGTTTNHALWMGVPTLTLVGETPASRQGAANLAHLGLGGFTAADPDDFVAKGLYWSGHLEELAGVRAGMRERWLSSPSRDPKLLAESLERGIRVMWQRWCAGLHPVSFDVS